MLGHLSRVNDGHRLKCYHPRELSSVFRLLSSYFFQFSSRHSLWKSEYWIILSNKYWFYLHRDQRCLVKTIRGTVIFKSIYHPQMFKCQLQYTVKESWASCRSGDPGNMCPFPCPITIQENTCKTKTLLQWLLTDHSPLTGRCIELKWGEVTF